MNKAIIGKKLAMSQIFAPDGTVIPVTIVQAGPCPVVQKKTLDNDGYEAIQIAFGEIKERNVTKPIKGHYKKAGVTPRRVLREFKTDVASYELGQELKCDQFAVRIIGRRKRYFKGTRFHGRSKEMESSLRTYGSRLGLSQRRRLYGRLFNSFESI